MVREKVVRTVCWQGLGKNKHGQPSVEWGGMVNVGWFG